MLDLSDIGILLDTSRPIALVGGDTATGKTFLMNRLKYLQRIKDKRMDGVLLITADTDKHYAVDANAISTSDLVIIDRWEIVAREFPLMVDKVNAASSPVILFARETVGANVVPAGVGELIRQDGNLCINFPLLEGV